MTVPLIMTDDTDAGAEAAAAEVRIDVETAARGKELDALIERAFGPGRFAKVSQRLREGNVQRMDLSFMAVAAGQVVGGVRQWPVEVGGSAGIFLGPIAVEGGWRKHGVGAALIQRACVAAAQAGEPFVLLVGDLGLFEPHGFEVVPAGRVLMPSPVDKRRILWRALSEGGLDGVGGEARVPRHAG